MMRCLSPDTVKFEEDKSINPATTFSQQPKQLTGTKIEIIAVHLLRSCSKILAKARADDENVSFHNRGNKSISSKSV